MRLSTLGELPLVDAIRARFKASPRDGVILGIGDDAAALKPAKGKLLATTDMMVEGVHFDLAYFTPEQLGFKLVSVNVSDIYAMGGSPRHMLLGLAMHGGVTAAFVDGLYRGIGAAAKLYGVALVGGDLSGAPKGAMALSATLLGEASRPIARSGAKPGHKIYVTGPLGDAAGGLGILEKIKRRVDLGKPINKPLPWDTMRPLLARHLMPLARRPSPAVTKAASAMIDLSDGLLIDLHRLCKENGLGARLHSIECLPVSEALRAASAYLGVDPVELALGGGEDYELLYTAPVTKGRRLPGFEIGVMVEEKGIAIEGGQALRPKGYSHFRGNR